MYIRTQKNNRQKKFAKFWWAKEESEVLYSLSSNYRWKSLLNLLLVISLVWTTFTWIGFVLLLSSVVALRIFRFKKSKKSPTNSNNKFEEWKKLIVPSLCQFFCFVSQRGVSFFRLFGNIVAVVDIPAPKIENSRNFHSILIWFKEKFHYYSQLWLGEFMPFVNENCCR